MEEMFEFVFKGPLEIEETFADRAILKGVFLRLNKITKNGREYQIEEGEAIANNLVGMPVFFGTDPFTNKHLKGAEFQVGRVFKSIFNKAKQIVEGAVEVWNTNKFPDLIGKLKTGFGFSIGGRAKDLKPTGALNKIGRAVMKVIGMIPNHLQLLEPTAVRGQEEAQVKDVQPVEESLSFDPCPWGVCELPEESVENPDPVTVDEETDVKETVHKVHIKRFIKVEDPYSTVV